GKAHLLSWWRATLAKLRSGAWPHSQAWPASTGCRPPAFLWERAMPVNGLHRGRTFFVSTARSYKCAASRLHSRENLRTSARPHSQAWPAPTGCRPPAFVETGHAREWLARRPHLFRERGSLLQSSLSRKLRPHE